MFILTPERRFVFAFAGSTGDLTATLASPNSVGQVTIINALTLVQGNAENPIASELNEGTLAVMLTTDAIADSLLVLGGAGQSDSDGDNLVIGALTFQNRVGVVVEGGAVAVPQKAAYNWRGLSFTRRPMSNVDMEVLMNIATASFNIDVLVTLYYQIAQLEPGDVGGLSDSLPVGVRVVRGAQIPEDGVAGPAGLVSLT